MWLPKVMNVGSGGRLLPELRRATTSRDVVTNVKQATISNDVVTKVMNVGSGGRLLPEFLCKMLGKQPREPITTLGVHMMVINCEASNHIGCLV